MSQRRALIGAVTVGVVALGLTLSGGVAYAGYSNVGFDHILPYAQLITYTAEQTKAQTGANGHIDVYTVGASYTISARMCYLWGNGCGGTVDGLSGGDWANLPAKGNAGEKLNMGLNVSTWNSVSVQTTGVWRTN